jgi:hypothetical protein
MVRGGCWCEVDSRRWALGKDGVRYCRYMARQGSGAPVVLVLLSFSLPDVRTAFAKSIPCDGSLLHALQGNCRKHRAALLWLLCPLSSGHPVMVTRTGGLCHKKLAFSAKPFCTSALSALMTDPKWPRTVPRFHPIGAAPKPWAILLPYLEKLRRFFWRSSLTVCLFLPFSVRVRGLGRWVCHGRTSHGCCRSMRRNPSICPRLLLAKPLPSPRGGFSLLGTLRKGHFGTVIILLCHLGLRPEFRMPGRE